MHEEVDDATLTAYALGELSEEKRAAIEALLARSEDDRRAVDDITATAQSLRAAFASEAREILSPAQLSAIDAVASGGPAALPRPNRWSGASFRIVAGWRPRRR